jgi:hypothetical protein
MIAGLNDLAFAFFLIQEKFSDSGTPFQFPPQKDLFQLLAVQ